MKKLGSLFIVVMMVVGLMGCADNNVSPNNVDANNMNVENNLDENNELENNNEENNNEENNEENNNEENNEENNNVENNSNNNENQENSYNNNNNTEDENAIVEDVITSGTAKLYFSHISNDEETNTQDHYLMAEEVELEELTVENVVMELLKGPSDEDLDSTLHILSADDFLDMYQEGNIAYIDFKSDVDLTLNQSGSAGAQFAFGSIISSLCLSNDLGVDSVQFLLEGEIVAAIGPEATDKPLTPNMNMIK